MATQKITIVSCDLCAQEGSPHAVTFDGDSFEIDLCKNHGDGLAETLASWAAAGRPVAKRAPRAPRPRPARPDNSAIRTWARSEGHDISPRGRVPAEIAAAYEAAHAVA